MSEQDKDKIAATNGEGEGGAPEVGSVHPAGDMPGVGVKPTEFVEGPAGAEVPQYAPTEPGLDSLMQEADGAQEAFYNTPHPAGADGESMPGVGVKPASFEEGPAGAEVPQYAPTEPGVAATYAQAEDAQEEVFTSDWAAVILAIVLCAVVCLGIWAATLFSSADSRDAYDFTDYQNGAWTEPYKDNKIYQDDYYGRGADAQRSSKSDSGSSSSAESKSDTSAKSSSSKSAKSGQSSASDAASGASSSAKGTGTAA